VPHHLPPGPDEFPSTVEGLIQQARAWFPDADPAQLGRAVEQSLTLRNYDDHGLTAFAFVVSMLKAGIPIEDVVQIVALTKVNLMGQHRMDTGEHPDEI
jgi:hypothetical protein